METVQGLMKVTLNHFHYICWNTQSIVIVMVWEWIGADNEWKIKFISLLDFNFSNESRLRQAKTLSLLHPPLY